MNAPLPRSRYGKKFGDNYDKIFDKAPPKTCEHGHPYPDYQDTFAPTFCGKCYTVTIPLDDSTEPVQNFEIKETPK